VDQGRGEAGHGVQQGVLGVDGDAVGLAYGHVTVHHDRDFGAQPVTDPAQPQLTHPAHPGDLGQRPLGPVHQGRIDRVHHPAEHLPRGVPQHQRDRRRDRQPDDRVGQLPAQGRSAGAQQHGQ
jgi:hypothetical protein